MNDIILFVLLLIAIVATCYCCYQAGKAAQWEEDHEEAELMTNADKIRAMPIKDLAAFLYDAETLSSWCVGRHGETDCPDGGCLMCWENWLKQEAE